MKFLGKNLLMVCLAVMVSCISLCFYGGTANAMTLSDLQGTYRITGSDTVWGDAARGGLVEIRKTGKGFVGIARNTTSNGNGFRAGDEVIYDVWVDSGVIHCKADYSIASRGWDSTIKVYNGGQTLRVEQNDKPKLFWVLERVN